MKNRLMIASLAVILLALAVAPAFAAPASAPAGTPAVTAAPASPAPAANGAAPVRQKNETVEANPPKAGEEKKTEEPKPGAPDDKGQNMWPLYAIGGAMIIMLIFSSRSKKKQEAKRREQLNAIKKGDTITSIGGIIGTVVEVRDKDLIIKIDDGTRMHLARWAIRGIGDNSMTDETEKK